MRFITTIAAATVFALSLGGCARTTETASGSGPEVVAAVYPLAFAAEAILGDAGVVTDLTPPGVEPHDLELTPRQVEALTRADLIIYLGGGFQPAVEAALGPLDEKAIDVLDLVPTLEDDGHEEDDGHGHGPIDPHVWLDPSKMSLIADAIAGALAGVAPEEGDGLRARADRLREELDELDRDFEGSLEDCSSRDLVVSHEAFGYLADRYDLDQTGIAGLEPEAEPSPRRIGEVVEHIRDRRITTIFFEVSAPPTVAETVAREAGVDTAPLDPLETAPADGDYLSAMRTNLATLRNGLGCG
jgi:zinc transport system substrate-binding protein